MTTEPPRGAESPPAPFPAPESGQTVGGRENGAGESTGASTPEERLRHYFAEVDPGGWPPPPEFTRDAARVFVIEQDEPELPVSSLRDALPFLRRPFAPNAIRWKVQAQFGGKKMNAQTGKGYEEPPHSAQIAPYINAATVVDLLNLVCGPMWSDAYESVTQGTLRCHLTIDGVTRSDVGDGGLTKAGHSDALKRAAMRFGVGVFLRATPRIVLRSGGKQPEANQLRVGSKNNLFLTDANLDKLRKGYAGWLASDEGRSFGEPFDFGDVVDALGDPDEGDESHEPTPEGVDESGEITDPGPKIKVARVRALTKEVETAPPWITPDEINVQLDELGAAKHDDLLERLKLLREKQADGLQAWLEGAPVEMPSGEIE